MRRRRIVGLALAFLLASGAILVLLRMGPRNLWGMLRYDQRQEGALVPGAQAPDLVLTALDGVHRVPLRAHQGRRPLVLIFGSYT
jgi:hypothetical protein